MDLNSAVEFSNSTNGSDMLQTMIDEFRTKTQEMGFYDKRVAYSNYHPKMEDELKAAYDETTKLEKDLKKLFTITEVLLEKQEEYENRMGEIKSEYLSENNQYLHNQNKEKDNAILELEQQVNNRDRKVKKLNVEIKNRENRIEELEETIENQDAEIAKLNENLMDNVSELEEKVRSLQDLIEYKDEYINEVQEERDQISSKLDILEKEKDKLENINERLTKDLNDTKSNMTHYRSSCQKLSKELDSASESIQMLENQYEVLLRKQSTQIIKRVDSGTNLESIENQLENSQDDQPQPFEYNANNVQNDEDEMQGETLGDELAGLDNDIEDDNIGMIEGEFDEDAIIDGDFDEQMDFQNQDFNEEIKSGLSDDISEQPHKNSISEVENMDFINTVQSVNEFGTIEPEISQENYSKEQSDMNMQTDTINMESEITQTLEKKVICTDFDTQTDEFKSEMLNATVQTEKFARSVINVKTQTAKINFKDKSTDTCSLKLESDENAMIIKVSSPKDENINSTATSPSSTNLRKPDNLSLDNISSPPDSGNHSQSKENAFSSKNSNKNKNSLNYMLNRDPLKEFFHLTLQSIKMNSIHMNQILNINADMFYDKAVNDSIPFNKWNFWLEDQINRIILSKILKMNMWSKLETKNEDSKIQDKVQKMDSLQVADMIKKMPITSKSKPKSRGLFSFSFMKKAKKDEFEQQNTKPPSEFDEIFQKAKQLPLTSRNTAKKSFDFPDEDLRGNN